jgi:hypothetical protein
MTKPQTEAERVWVQDNCPYCHGTECDPLDTKIFGANEDGYVSSDLICICWVNLYGDTPKLQMETDYGPAETVPINYCPMCGRKLDGK